jgi:hypothetical protein
VQPDVDYYPDMFEDDEDNVLVERILPVVYLDPKKASSEQVSRLQRRLAEAEAAEAARKKAQAGEEGGAEGAGARTRAGAPVQAQRDAQARDDDHHHHRLPQSELRPGKLNRGWHMAVQHLLQRGGSRCVLLQRLPGASFQQIVQRAQLRHFGADEFVVSEDEPSARLHKI